MGLDMYLEARKYVDGEEDSERLEVHGMRVRTLVYEAMYWRKANAIHRWFVENVQDNKDDCGYYYVSREQLKELLTACQKVLTYPTMAQELLPTRDGFFFGSTDYDVDYLDDLKQTAEGLTKILDWYTDDDWSWVFYYHSSW